MAKNQICSLHVVAFGILLMLKCSNSEIFTNPFLLREAFLTEGRLVKIVTDLGIERNSTLGQAIEE